MTRLVEFLEILRSARWRNPPQAWHEQMRAALNDNLIRVGFGGLLELTEAGKQHIATAIRNRKSGAREGEKG